MARRIFLILAAVSLLLFGATITLHIRSYWRSDFLERQSIQPVPGGRDYFRHGIQVACGRIALYAVGGTFGMPPQRAAEKLALRDPRWHFDSFLNPEDPTRFAGNAPSFWNQLGFSHESVTWFHAGKVDSSRTLTLPMGLVDLATLAIPAAWIAAARARKRRRLYRIRQGLCSTCSYDLRAHMAGKINSVLDSTAFGSEAPLDRRQARRELAEVSTHSSSPLPRCPECGTPIPAHNR